MAIGRTNAGGSGGAGLNFKVIGNPQPSTAKENTIWIDTDQKITGWEFSPTEPNETKNMVKSYVVGNASAYHQALYIDFDLKPNKTYTMCFDGSEGHKYYTNESLFDPVIDFTVTSGKTVVQLTVKDALPSGQYHAGKGWVILKNRIAQSSELAFNNLQVVEGDGNPEGMVWISTGTSSETEFNALKKNGIQVYPLSAKQYVSGVWVDKTAKSYQGGKWVPWWNGELYENGNEYTSVTGGWTLNGYYHTTNPNKLMEAQLTDTHIYLLSESNKECGVGTENPIDLSKYDTLTVSGEVLAIKNYNGINYGLQVSVLTSKAVNTSIEADKQINSVGKFDQSISVSTLSGKYYITVRTAGLTGAEGKVTSVKLS